LPELRGVKLAPTALTASLATALTTSLAAALTLIIILGLSRKAQPGGDSRDQH
jgi:hypothetical protein